MPIDCCLLPKRPKGAHCLLPERPKGAHCLERLKGATMTWKITRTEPDGTVALVGYASDPIEIGVMMDEDRAKIDWEPRYMVEQEK